MTEERQQDPDAERTGGEEDSPTDDVVKEIEDDPSTAGPPDEPGDELRGG
jgi:hypothetical protein